MGLFVKKENPKYLYLISYKNLTELFLDNFFSLLLSLLIPIILIIWFFFIVEFEIRLFIFSIIFLSPISIIPFSMLYKLKLKKLGLDEEQIYNYNLMAKQQFYANRMKYNNIKNYICNENKIIIYSKFPFPFNPKMKITNLSSEEISKIEEILQNKGVKKLENTQNQN